MARSNRPLTDFAIGKIKEYVDLGADRFVPAIGGNTSVRLEKSEGHENVLFVTLHGERIVEIVSNDHGFQSVAVYDGGFYDGLGRPSRTTRERLNGILDHLGAQQIIPEDVRVFLDRDSNVCYVGRDDERQPIGKNYSPVVLTSNPYHVEFE